MVSSLLTKALAASGSALRLVGLAATPALAAAQPAPATSASTGVTGGSAPADPGKATRSGSSQQMGGTWSWGVWDGENHSIYANERYDHTATVCGSNGQCTKRTAKKHGLANAHRHKTTWGNKAYWNAY